MQLPDDREIDLRITLTFSAPKNVAFSLTTFIAFCYFGEVDSQNTDELAKVYAVISKHALFLRTIAHSVQPLFDVLDRFDDPLRDIIATAIIAGTRR